MALRFQAGPRAAQSQPSRGAMLAALYDTGEINGWREGMQAVTLALLGAWPGSAPLAPQPWGERPASPAMLSEATPRIGGRGADDQNLRYPGLGDVVLEVGCGDGGLLAALDAPGRTLLGLDLHPAALGRAQAGAAVRLVHVDAQQIPCADGSVGALLALDVFDQQGVDLAAALAESRRALAPDGVLILRVSAHPWLYGPHDAAFNSGRRYGRAELLAALADAGFHVRRVTYANSLLAPLLILQRLLQRWRVLSWNPAIYRAGWSNRLVAAALKTEAHWLRRRNLAFGLSLIVIAEKREGRKLKIEN